MDHGPTGVDGVAGSTSRRQVFRLQRAAGNTATVRVLQREVPADAALHRTCLARRVFTALSDDELVETIAAVDRLVPTLHDEAERLTARGNRREARRQQATRRHGDFDAHALAVSSATGRKARRAAVRALVQWSRDQLDTYPDLVTRFRRQQQPDMDEKVAVLGRAAAAVARMEFLLGTVFHRGGSWESSSNKGTMVDDYTGGKAGAWCSKFATTALRAIRGGKTKAASGYKIANPDEFAGVDLDYATAQGGAFVGTQRSRRATAGNNPFVELRQTLQGIADGTITDQTASEAATTFLQDRIRPQPGDIVVVRRGSARRNSFTRKGDRESHTLMVESVQGTEVSLIEGNAGPSTDRVTGRVLDLSDVGDVEDIVFISRPSLASGLDAAETARIGSEQVDEADQVVADDLLAPIDDLNLLLEDLARTEGDVSDGAAGGSVAELVGNA